MGYYDKNKEETAWNVGKFFSQHIAYLIQEMSKSQRGNDLIKWFSTLKTLRDLLDFGLSKKEIRVLDKAEGRCLRYKKSWEDWNSRITNFDEDKSKKMEAAMFYKSLRAYQKEILQILKKMGFFPTKVDARFLAGGSSTYG